MNPESETDSLNMNCGNEWIDALNDPFRLFCQNDRQRYFSPEQIDTLLMRILPSMCRDAKNACLTSRYIQSNASVRHALMKKPFKDIWRIVELSQKASVFLPDYFMQATGWVKSIHKTGRLRRGKDRYGNCDYYDHNGYEVEIKFSVYTDERNLELSTKVRWNRLHLYDHHIQRFLLIAINDRTQEFDMYLLSRDQLLSELDDNPETFYFSSGSKGANAKNKCAERAVTFNHEDASIVYDRWQFNYAIPDKYKRFFYHPSLYRGKLFNVLNPTE